MDSGVFIYKAGRTNRNSMNFVIICGSAEGRPPQPQIMKLNQIKVSIFEF